MKKIIIGLVAILFIAGGAYYYFAIYQHQTDHPKHQTADNDNVVKQALAFTELINTKGKKCKSIVENDGDSEPNKAKMCVEEFLKLSEEEKDYYKKINSFNTTLLALQGKLDLDKDDEEKNMKLMAENLEYYIYFTKWKMQIR